MSRALTLIVFVAFVTAGGIHAGSVLGATPALHLAASPVASPARVAPLPLTGDRRDAFASTIAELMGQGSVPGGAVAVVQGSDVVYLEGFGVRELGGTEPVTTDTLLM